MENGKFLAGILIAGAVIVLIVVLYKQQKKTEEPNKVTQTTVQTKGLNFEGIGGMAGSFFGLGKK